MMSCTVLDGSLDSVSGSSISLPSLSFIVKS